MRSPIATLITAAALLLLTSVPAGAQQLSGPALTLRHARLSADTVLAPKITLDTRALRLPAAAEPRRRQVRSKAKRALWAAVGGAGGFFGGAFLGAALEPDCNCDDPGFRGFLIGAPVGAATGAILGWKFGR